MKHGNIVCILRIHETLVKLHNIYYQHCIEKISQFQNNYFYHSKGEKFAEQYKILNIPFCFSMENQVNANTACITLVVKIIFKKRNVINNDHDLKQF